jgi:hypothetical protein
MGTRNGLGLGFQVMLVRLVEPSLCFIQEPNIVCIVGGFAGLCWLPAEGVLTRLAGVVDGGPSWICTMPSEFSFFCS